MIGEIKSYTEYGVFEDPEFWEPLFASGELPDSMRNIITDPKDGSTGLSLWHAYKWAELQNETRAREPDKVDKYGLMIVKKRLVIEHFWSQVRQEEIEAVRRA
jgi:hypothetical protein